MFVIVFIFVFIYIYVYAYINYVHVLYKKVLASLYITLYRCLFGLRTFNGRNATVVCRYTYNTIVQFDEHSRAFHDAYASRAESVRRIAKFFIPVWIASDRDAPRFLCVLCQCIVCLYASRVAFKKRSLLKNIRNIPYTPKWFSK